jgi:regulator of ribonuclease activity A
VCPDGRAARAVRLRKRLGRGSHNGCICDSEEISKFTVGVTALYTVPKRSAKEGVGERDVPVNFAGTPLPLQRVSKKMDG